MTTAAKPTIRDRVREVRRVPASSLVRNEKNWTKHPEEQRAGLRAVFNEVGFAIPNVGYELPDGRIKLIDGEARSDAAGDAVVPVVILDVTEAEADQLLATINPIGMLVEVNRAVYGQLIAGLDVQTEDMASVLKSVSAKLRLSLDKYTEGEAASPEETPSTTRMVPLYFETRSLDEFRREVLELSTRYGTEGIAATVLEAIRRAHAAA